MIAKGKLPVLAGGVSLLVGCVQPPPMPQPVIYYPAPQTARPAPSSYYAPPAPRQAARRPVASPPATTRTDDVPWRPLTPEESGTAGPSWFSSWMSSSPPSGDCVGWWRICHLY